MGRKRNIKRHKSFFYIACCLISIWMFSGCEYKYYPKLSIENSKSLEGRGILDSAREFALNGDFQTAFEENTKAYEIFPAEFKAAAIFQKGLLHSHPDNPDQSYEKAMVCFELVEKEQPDFIFEYNAELLLSTLKGNCELGQQADLTEKDIQQTRKTLEKRQEKIQSLLQEQKKLKNYIAKLREQIKQLKEVDLSSRKKIEGVLSE